jgi:hypothetical protein
MSFYSQNQSQYAQSGWTHFGARTTVPPREHYGPPIMFALPVAGVIFLPQPVWL